MLRSTTCQGERHRVGREGERERERKWPASVGGTGPGTGKGKDWRKWGRQCRKRTKRHTLVGDVQEYWGAYLGEGDDTFWNIQYT